MFLKLLRALPITVLAVIFFSFTAAAGPVPYGTGAGDYPLRIEKGYHKLYLKNTQRNALSDLMLDSDLYLDSSFYEIPSSFSMLYSGSRAASGLNALRYLNLRLESPAWQLTLGDAKGGLSDTSLKEVEYFGLEYKSRAAGLDYTILAGKPRYLSSSVVSGGTYSYTHVFPRAIYGLRAVAHPVPNFSLGLNYSLEQDDPSVLNALSSGLLVATPLYSSILSLDTQAALIPETLEFGAEYARGSFDSNLNDATGATQDSALSLKGNYKTAFFNLSADYSRVGSDFRLPQDFKGKAAVLPVDREGYQANLMLSPSRMLALDLNYRTHHNNLAQATGRSTQTYATTGGKLNIGGQSILPMLSLGYQQMVYGGPAAGATSQLARKIYQRSVGIAQNFSDLSFNYSLSQYDNLDETGRTTDQQSQQSRGGLAFNFSRLNAKVSGNYVNTRYYQITTAQTSDEGDSTQLSYALNLGQAGLTPLLSVNRAYSTTQYFTGTSGIHQNVSTSLGLVVPLFDQRFSLAGELGLLQTSNNIQTINNALSTFNFSADYKSDEASQLSVRYKNSTFQNNLAAAQNFVDHSLEFKYTYYFGAPAFSLPRVNAEPRLVRGRVFEDKNSNQQYDTGEEITGTRLVLEGGKTAVTNNAGEYVFAYLMPGRYEIEIDPATVSARFTEDNFRKSFVLSEHPEKIDFILAPGSVIKGSIFADRNHNKKQDSGETGIPNVNVVLLNAAGQESKTKTDLDGAYGFEINPGRYRVSIETFRFRPTSKDSYNLEVYPGDTVSNLDFGTSLNY